MTPLAAYLLLFIAVGTGFIFVHLVAGKLIRPSTPSAEKGTTYECGEPTIGSAWIQFDLRFYVVALLFVIFDVEVAFFFPWAEVFGKANAIANAPEPRTAAQYNDLGEKILDLAIPSDTTVAEGQLRRWKKMASLTDKELAATALLDKDQKELLRGMKKEPVEALQKVTPEQRAMLKSARAELQTTLASQAKAREAALKPLIDSGNEKERTRLRPLVEGILTSEKTLLRTTTLADFKAGRVPILTFLSPPPPRQGQPSPVFLAARENGPLLAGLLRLSAEQKRQLSEQAGRLLTALETAGPTQTALWNALSVSLLQGLEGMNDAQFAALGDVTREGILVVTNPIALAGTRDQARTIAWLALGEILVFFGVLLVGFAYLWKRGDLAWVRSTTAAATVERVEAEQAALVPEAAQTLQHAGAGTHSGSSPLI